MNHSELLLCLIVLNRRSRIYILHWKKQISDIAFRKITAHSFTNSLTLLPENHGVFSYNVILLWRQECVFYYIKVLY